MKKKIAIFALSIFALGAIYTVNAENTEVKEVKGTNACKDYQFSCGKTGTVCGSGNLDEDAAIIDQHYCGSKGTYNGDAGGPLGI